MNSFFCAKWVLFLIALFHHGLALQQQGFMCRAQTSHPFGMYSGCTTSLAIGSVLSMNDELKYQQQPPHSSSNTPTTPPAAISVLDVIHNFDTMVEQSHQKQLKLMKEINESAKHLLIQATASEREHQQ